MGNPINLNIMTVTSYYGMRNWGGRFHMHRGVDLRCVDEKFNNMPVLAVEDMKILKTGTGWRIKEGYIIAKGLESGIKFKYIHVKWSNIKKGDEVKEFETIGLCNYSGTDSLHLHFETWRRGVIKWKHFDPLEYFHGNGIDWRTSRYLKKKKL